MSVTFEFWNDTGYTESGVERPPIGATLSSPDRTYYDLNPQRNNLFSSVQIRAPYTDLYKASYLRATYSFNESEDLVLYGWVDDVSMVSDTDDFPSTQVSWHVDLWRTFARNAVFKAGTVRRRPLTADVPPQPYPYRYWEAAGNDVLVPLSRDYNDNPIWWVYVGYTAEYDDAETTGFETICFPMSFSDHIYIKDGTSYVKSPSVAGVSGFFDEYLGLTPSKIAGCYLSPIAPKPYTGDGSTASPIDLRDDNAWTVMKHTTSVSDTFGAFEGGNSNTRYKSYREFTGSLPRNTATDDINRYVITGFDGEPLGALPWGLNVRNYTYRMIVEPSGCYIEIRFRGLDSRTQGLGFAIPCIPLNVTSNSWSEYLYTGMREYDINMRNTQSQQAFLKDTIGALTGAGEQAGLATMFGGSNTVKGRVMMKGGAITAAAHMIGSTASFLTDYYYFNNEYQEWSDYAAANQSDNLLASGGGWDTILFGRTVCMVKLQADDYSTTQRNTDISMYGAHVTEPLSSCQALVEAGGPLQITNMTIGGNIPVEAKDYIQRMFSNGVRLV